MEPILSPHACANCKHSHIRCDKIMPRCGTCTSKDRDCNFDEKPLKRGPKKDSVDDVSIGISKKRTRSKKTQKKMVSPTKVQFVANEHLTSTRIPKTSSSGDLFESYILFNCPCLNPNDALTYVEHINNTALSKPEEDVTALASAVRSWFYSRFSGKTQISADCARHSTEIITSQIDKAQNNYNLAASCLYLAQYNLSNNDQAKTVGYLKIVEDYLRNGRLRQQQDNLHLLKERHLELLYQNALSFLEKKTDMLQVLKRYIYSSFVTSKLKKIYDGPNNHAQLPQYKFDEFTPFLRQMKYDLDNDTHQMFILDYKAIDFITERIKSGTVVNHPGIINIGDLRNNACMLLVQGAKMQYALSEVQKSVQGDFDRWMKEAADFISALCEANCSCLYIYNFSACSAHLALLVYIRQLNLQDQNFIDPVRDEIVMSMTSIIKFFRSIFPVSELLRSRHEQIVYECDQFIQGYNIQSMNYNSDAFQTINMKHEFLEFTPQQEAEHFLSPVNNDFDFDIESMLL